MSHVYETEWCGTHESVRKLAGRGREGNEKKEEKEKRKRRKKRRKKGNNKTEKRSNNEEMKGRPCE